MNAARPTLSRSRRAPAVLAGAAGVGLLAALLAGWGWPGPATPLAAQQLQEPPLPDIFQETVEVRVVNIEVVVTDRQGNRVSGLGPQDFRLKVDGEVVPIDYFSEILEGRGAPAQGGPVASVPSVAPGQPVGTNFLVFIDDFFAIASDRDRVLDRLEQQLVQLRPGDRVAVVAFDGKALAMLTPWTDSPRELERALRAARQREAFGVQHQSSLRLNDQERRQRRDMGILQIERSGVDVPESVVRTSLAGPDLDFANRLATQVERSVMGAVSTLRSFASPQGRKVMIVLSGGWPFAPAEYTINDFSASPEDAMTKGALSETRVKGYDALFAPLVDTANLLGYTLYAVDVQGLYRDTVFDASLGASDVITGAALTNESPARGLPRELQIHQGLEFLADRTGGEALINAQRDHSLEEVIGDTRSYYWLGFQPQRQEDDRHHAIEVEVVSRPELRVRAREGFVDLSRDAEVTMMVESALLVGNPPSAKPLVVHFGRPKQGGSKLRVPVEVGIPLDDITLIPTAGRYVNELQIRITVMDENGYRSDTATDTISINGEKPPRPGQLMYYETELTLRKRNHRIVVAVYDPLSGTILSSSGDVGPQ